MSATQRHNEWLTFLRQIGRETPQGKTLHLICDNYPTYKHPGSAMVEEVYPVPYPLHPHLASSLNMIERFFRDLTGERPGRSVFTSVPQLLNTIEAYIAQHNANPKPFVWTTAKAGNDILKQSSADSPL